MLRNCVSWLRTGSILAVGRSNLIKRCNLQGKHHSYSNTNQRRCFEMAVNNTSSVKDDKEAYDQLFDVLQNDLMPAKLLNEDTADAFKRFYQVNEYNVPLGTHYGYGLTVVQSLRYLMDSRELTEDILKRARVIGWCIEWFQTAYIITDDMMDSTPVHYGLPCWYKVDGVGRKAIYDAMYLEAAAYFLLKKYLGDQTYYIKILELFHEAILQTVVGQNLDMISAPVGYTDFTSFTKKRHEAIVYYKTSFFTVYFPMACAMYMAGITDEELFNEAKPVLLKIGLYFQIQDDFWDCYGYPAKSGELGTDIQENKCTWLIVQALSLASKEQKAILQENYGRHEKECVAKVKEIYEELKLKELYANYEERSYAEVMELINTTNIALPKEMLQEYVRKIYKYMFMTK